MSVSMKQSYSDASGKGTVPAAEGYDRLRGLQVDMNVGICSATFEMDIWTVRIKTLRFVN